MTTEQKTQGPEPGKFYAIQLHANRKTWIFDMEFGSGTFGNELFRFPMENVAGYVLMKSVYQMCAGLAAMNGCYEVADDV